MRGARIVLLATLLVALVFPASAYAQKLVLVVRHVERADGGSMSATAQTDPRLSAAGEARAKKLATMLAESGVKGIYASEYRRTQDTAKPLAETLKLTVVSVASKDTTTLLARIKNHANDIVLIVAHSNTVPEIIKALGGPAVTVAEEDYGNIFVLVPATGALTKIRY